MRPRERIIHSLVAIFRDNGFESLYAIEVLLQILAWVKLSREGSIPDKLKFTGTAGLANAEFLSSTFQQLSELQSLGDNRAAFRSIKGRRSGLTKTLVVFVLKLINELIQKDNLDQFEIPESWYNALDRSRSQLVWPPEISDLMLAIGEPLANKQVYCPYDTACLLARRASKKGADVYVESAVDSPIPWLNNLLTATNIHAKVSDPVTQPGYLKKGGTLKKFDITLAFPALGGKYVPIVAREDRFDRFRELTTSGSVLRIRHIIAQTKDRAIIAVPNGVLFGRGAEHSLRRDLVQRREVEGIISLPPAILPFTPVNCSILIIKLCEAVTNIRFVDGSNDRFFEKDGKGRSQLVNWHELLDVFYSGTDEDVAVTVPVEEVIHQDSLLEVSRYVLPPEQKKAQQLLRESEVQKLKNLVDFVRPSPKIQDDGVLTAYEASVADFPEFGYLTAPKRRVSIAKSTLTAKEAQTFLRPGDIVIATKGSVGKLAIISDQVPPPGEGGWLVNQSCLILRPNNNIESKPLFMYLRSNPGQALLASIVSGATIPLIQLRALQNMQVIVPSIERGKSIAKTFDMQVDLQEKIEALREEQHKLRNIHWNIG